MELLLPSFFFGILTVLSPCVLPLLPVIVGGSLVDGKYSRAFLITISLAVSIVLFTLILKYSTALIMVDPMVWQSISGGIVFIFGIFTVFPHLWEKISFNLRLSDKSNVMLSESSQKKGWLGSVLIGMSLGPVFASCSPTYALILATVLPTSFAKGILYLGAYAVGLAFIMLLVSVFGQAAVNKMRWAANPEGWFRKILGIIFIIVGLSIMTGLEKKAETFLLEKGYLNFTRFEADYLDKALSGEEKDEAFLNVEEPYEAPELRGIQAWINSDGETLTDLKSKVVLVDFWTYSCINCIRTIPYLNSWHEKYEDDGLVILGIHAPEFQFEKIEKNVRAAVEDYEIKYPVGMDNNFETWRAYENRFWPAKYFIDREGNLRHYHFGEGEYEESEKVIRYLLEEDGSVITDEVGEEGESKVSAGQTPETYLGLKRRAGDYWSLEGDWKEGDEDIEAMEDGAKLTLEFSAKNVYLVMGSDEPAKVEVELNGEVLKEVEVSDYKLYELVNSDEFLDGAVLELSFGKGVKANAFTFGS